MIVFKDKKIVILMNARCGTKSMRSVLQNIPGYNIVYPHTHWHGSFVRGKELISPKIDDWSGFRVFGFYRDPLERWVSGLAWWQEKYPEKNFDLPIQELFATHGGFIHQSLILNDNFFMDPWDNPENISTNVELLDYNNFDEGMKMIGDLVGVNIGTMPIVNSAINKKNLNEYSAEDIQFIKDVYDRDYKYFAARGIVVPSA